MIIKFKVANQNIKRTDTNKVVADSKNYLYAKFEFSDDWSGTKTAIFRHGDIIKHVILTDDNTCKVPHEVIKSGVFTVSIFAGDLITADTADVFVSASGYADGGDPEEPTPDIYSQIIARLDAMTAGTVTDEQIQKAVEDYLVANPVESMTEEDVQQIVADYVTAHKEDLRGNDGYTPVKGTDYWTDADKSEMVNAVLAVLPTAESEVY